MIIIRRGGLLTTWRCASVLAAALFLIGEYLVSPISAADPIRLGPEDGAEIRDIIGRQLEAFRSDHAEQAFSYASPGIREKFGNPIRFMSMVKRHYPAVYRPREVEFLDLVNVNGTWVQVILFVDAGGDIYIAQYPMERQADGNWLIDGCMLARQGDKSI